MENPYSYNEVKTRIKCQLPVCSIPDSWKFFYNIEGIIYHILFQFDRICQIVIQLTHAMNLRNMHES